MDMLHECSVHPLLDHSKILSGQRTTAQMSFQRVHVLDRERVEGKEK